MTGPVTRRLLIEHVSSFNLREPARDSVTLLRLQPRNDGGQRVLRYALTIEPDAVTVPFTDHFGNNCHLFNVHRSHRHTVVHSHVEIESTDPPPLPDGLGARAWKPLNREAASPQNWEFLAPSRFARSSTLLAAFCEAKGIRRGRDPLKALRKLATTLNAEFSYEPGRTGVDSPIDHILKTGMGVCQDYTHVMIAIARSWGVPSRYVSGYLYEGDMPGEQASAGATHAWAEFLLPELGWTGIDATNDTLADHRHIRVAVGRDYGDAAPTRGVVTGGGASRLDVSVMVWDVEDDAPTPASYEQRSSFFELGTVVPGRPDIARQQ